MERTRVQSSNISSVGYDTERSMLEIEFTNGSVYQYLRVPAHVHERLMRAPSKGSYLNVEIKNRYEVRQVQ